MMITKAHTKIRIQGLAEWFWVQITNAEITITTTANASHIRQCFKLSQPY